MALPLEDYAVLGNMRAAALVGRDGSIDWLCLPRFDSGACFAALLGDGGNGCWRLAPEGASGATRWGYRGDTLVLESEFAVADGAVRVVDAMPVGDRPADVVRLVEGVRGRVDMCSELTVRFDYGHVVPWVRQDGRRSLVEAGPDGLLVEGGVPHVPDGDGPLTARFAVGAGERVAFRLGWYRPGRPPPEPMDVPRAIDDTAGWWRDWAGRCTYRGDYREAVVRSLLTLKALSHASSGGIVAAATTSLPERLGGVRNWDYRYCWLRDATFTLFALLDAGYAAEAVAWREWLLRAVAGRPDQAQIMYGVDGARRLPETELGWLAGYAGSRPVRVGNAAHGQFQLDVYGEVMDALHQARAHGLEPESHAWDVQLALMDFLESHWQEPDNGIWEVRGDRQHFVQSKVMAWAAADRAVTAVEDLGLDGPADRWRRLRQDIFDEVCVRGYDAERSTFTQSYGSRELDAALLTIAPVGFLPAADERVRGTVAAVERELSRGGFVFRYRTTGGDGLPSGEGAFLACSFWLADNYALQGRVAEARSVFERLLAVRTDLGLLSEEYDVEGGRLVGNLPQAFSHVPLVTTAGGIAGATGAVHRRSRSGGSAGAGR